MRSSTSLWAMSALLSGASAELGYLGVAMAGIDFGCAINGKCPPKNVQVPLASQGGADSAAQMQHFVKNDKMNIFRLPVSWQFLLNGTTNPGGKFDDINFGNYNQLMDACLDTGAYCMIDLHNFGRWEGGIIGQGGPPDEDFVNVWTQLASFYAKNDKVVFGLMNEPHDLDIKLWAKTCQKVVTGIRKAGATKQIILLPGDNFSSAETFVSTQSADMLNEISNPDGTKDNLLMDLHKYLDINNSGQHAECTTDNVQGFKTIADWLRKNNRTAMVSETGASMEPSCMEKFCAQNKFLAANTDVFIGFVGWGAGGFDKTYVLTLTPTRNSDGTYTDNKLMKQCILAPFQGKMVEPTTPASKPTASKPVVTGSPDPKPSKDAAAGLDISQGGFLLTAFSTLALLAGLV